MNTFVRAASTTLALIALTPAVASAKSYRHHDDSANGYAQVLSAQPVYQSVRISEPRQECWDQRVVYRDDYRNARNGSTAADRTIGTVLGGVIGGAIGHQFSAGSGKQIATAIGAVVGADIGRNAVRNGYQNDRPVSRERVAYEPQCRTVESTRYEQRIDGYEVTYRYAGQVYQTRMPYDPGSRLPVRVDVAPIRY
jgi:uncharacterized protein YcfJ